MWIAAGRIVIDCSGTGSATVKRRRIEELTQLLKKKFNLSVLEVADIDDLDRAVLGFAAVIPETWKERSARDFLDTIARMIDDNAFGRVMIEDCELLAHGEERPMIDDHDSGYDPSPSSRSKKAPASTGISQEVRDKIHRLRQKKD
jgi:uncharacterized protein YlxP (DUF503 family)